MPRVSAAELGARRQGIIDGARRCFAQYGYEGATVRLLEKAIGLSRGAIFHHFTDKESLFLAVAEADTATMVEVISKQGLVQVMRDLLRGEADTDRVGWLGTQLEVSRRVRTDPHFAKRWAERSHAIAAATHTRLLRQRRSGALRGDVDVAVLQRFLELAHDGLVLHLAMGRDATDLEPVLDLIEETVRRR